MTDTSITTSSEFNRIKLFGMKRSPFQDLYADVIFYVEAQIASEKPISASDFHGMFWMLCRDEQSVFQPLPGVDSNPQDVARIFEGAVTPRQEERRPLLQAALDEIIGSIKSGSHVMSPGRIYDDFDY